MNKKWKIISGIAVVLSLALLIISKVCATCDTGCEAMMTPMAMGASSAMRCQFTYKVEFLVSIAALLVSGALFLVKGAEGRRLNGLFLALLGVLAVLLPQSWVIGTCGSPSMACNKVLPWVYSASILLIVAGAVLAWLALRSVADQDSEQEEG